MRWSEETSFFGPLLFKCMHGVVVCGLRYHFLTHSLCHSPFDCILTQVFKWREKIPMS